MTSFLLNARAIVTIILFISGITCSSGQELTEKMIETMDYAKVQIDKTINSGISYSAFPRRNYEGASWETRNYLDWTSGFWPGCLWLMFEWTSDSTYLDKAVQWTENLEDIQWYTGNHDVGFQVMCSYGNGLRLAAEKTYKDVIIQTAESLSTRFDKNAGSIISWDSAPWNQCNKPVIVDNMMNLELLFKATQLSGDSSFHHMAVQHSHKCIKTHQRPNGSFYHIVDYDDYGDVIYKGNSKSWPAGLNERSWSRGQAWALYGFTMAYRFSREPEFLEAAEKLVCFLIDSIAPGYIPYYVINHPENPNKDASAAAIMFSGLVELFEITEDTAYLQLAENIFSALNQPPYLTIDEQYQSILAMCTENYDDQQKGLIYADYYFMEGMIRYYRLFSPGTNDTSAVSIHNAEKKDAFWLCEQGVNMPFNCSAHMRIIDMQGKMVSQKSHLQFTKGYNSVHFTDYVSVNGVYLVNIRTNQGRSFKDKLYIQQE